jgi:hypothetical protein
MKNASFLLKLESVFDGGEREMTHAGMEVANTDIKNMNTCCASRIAHFTTATLYIIPLINIEQRIDRINIHQKCCRFRLCNS